MTADMSSPRPLLARFLRRCRNTRNKISWRSGKKLFEKRTVVTAAETFHCTGNSEKGKHIVDLVTSKADGSIARTLPEDLKRVWAKEMNRKLASLVNGEEISQGEKLCLENEAGWIKNPAAFRRRRRARDDLLIRVIRNNFLLEHQEKFAVLTRIKQVEINQVRAKQARMNQVRMKLAGLNISRSNLARPKDKGKQRCSVQHDHVKEERDDPNDPTFCQFVELWQESPDNVELRRQVSRRFPRVPLRELLWYSKHGM